MFVYGHLTFMESEAAPDKKERKKERKNNVKVSKKENKKSQRILGQTHIKQNWENVINRHFKRVRIDIYRQD